MSDVDILKEVTEVVRGVLDKKYHKLAESGRSAYRIDVDITVTQAVPDDRVSSNLRYFAEEKEEGKN